ILDEVAREADLLSAIIVPNGYARLRFGLEAPAEVQIETDVGAASLIATQAPVALDPNQPERLRAITGGEPTQVRQDIQGDINALFIVLGGLSLLVGALGIANVTLVSVIERVGEIGLRRAVGAARRHIAAQFLLESTTLGLLGGIVGASLGVLIVVGASAVRDWTPVLEPWLPLTAPLLGAVVGLLAGVYPSWRAAGVEPIEALRQGL
ncbi:MAG TPA: ABC transporter permease, partial [Actinobacteria bacterium]|nr:ABC transporter permease [Actinomycetota bacterium]